jgi:hypothetical protein
MAINNGQDTGYKKTGAVLRVFAALFVCAIGLTSCGHRPSRAFRDTAAKILNSMDASVEKLRGFQEQIQQGNYEKEVKKNPAFLMYREVVEELHVSDVRLALYRKDTQKKRRADTDAEKRLRSVRVTYRDCAVALFIEVQDNLPDTGINRLFKNVPAYSEEIVEAIGGRLGVETHTTPPAESCSLYAKRAADFRRDYNLAP